MKFKKHELADSLTNFFLLALYESKKLLTSFSIQQYLLYDYYQAIKENRKNQEKNLQSRRQIKKTFYYLQRAKYIRLDKNKTVKLTDKGLYKAILLKSKYLNKTKHKASQEFYIVIFDVPERYKHLRNLFRKVLYNLGGELVQRSVFIIKGKASYIFLKDLIKESEIKDYVKIITAKKLE